MCSDSWIFWRFFSLRKAGNYGLFFEQVWNSETCRSIVIEYNIQGAYWGCVYRSVSLAEDTRMLHIAFSCPTINQQPINIQLATFHHWKSSTRNHAKKKVFLDLRWWLQHMWHYRDTFWMILPQYYTICDICYILEILYLSICVTWFDDCHMVDHYLEVLQFYM